jgi:hypothetical protein
VRPPAGTFAAEAAFSSEASDPMTRGVYEPLLGGVGVRFARFRFLQQGTLQIYLLYLLVAVVGGLAWVALTE